MGCEPPCFGKQVPINDVIYPLLFSPVSSRCLHATTFNAEVFGFMLKTSFRISSPLRKWATRGKQSVVALSTCYIYMQTNACSDEATRKSPTSSNCPLLSHRRKGTHDPFFQGNSIAPDQASRCESFASHRQSTRRTGSSCYCGTVGRQLSRHCWFVCCLVTFGPSLPQTPLKRTSMSLGPRSMRSCFTLPTRQEERCD